MKTDHVQAAVASLICATAAFARERIPVTDWTLADHGSVYAEAVGRGWLAEDNDGDYLTGRALSRVDYAADNATRWHRAVVPGTVLTSLVADGTYPEPTYGENNRPEVIPEPRLEPDVVRPAPCAARRVPDCPLELERVRLPDDRQVQAVSAASAFLGVEPREGRGRRRKARVRGTRVRREGALGDF